MATKTKKAPVFRKSILALAMMGICTTAAGQETNDASPQAEQDETEVIEVKGMRSDITAAQHLKRYSDTVIDSISAADIGSLPDKSVAEALQRVPGITVERFGTRTDTQAFSVEPSGVLVRGLSHVRSEFNGRDSFSANSSRGLSWGDVSPELMGGIDIYKSQTAELIEGGIAGLINLKTRLPFDSENDVKVVTLSSNYSDLSGSTTPEISGIYTTRFNTDMGEFGIMANIAYSDIDATSQSSRVGRAIKYRGVYGDNPDSIHYIPDNAYASDDLYARERLGTSLALQWQDLEGEFVATFQYNRSQKKQERSGSSVAVGLGNPFFEKSLQLEATPGGDGSNAIVVPAEGTDPLMFDEGGFFQTGQLVQGMGWVGNPDGETALFSTNSNGEPLINACYAWAGCSPELKAIGMGTSAGFFDSKTVTEDFSLNLKWHIADDIHASFDVQHIDATNDDYSMTAGFSSYTDGYIDLTGEQIKVIFNDPTNVNLLDAGQGVYANPNSYYLNNIMDMYEDSEGTEFAARADLVFDVHNEFIDTVKVGVRYADRSQQVNRANNWASVVNTWSHTAAFYNLDSAPTSGVFNDEEYDFMGYPDTYVIKEWESKYGDFTTADGNNLFVIPDVNAMKNWKNTMGASVTGIPSSEWEPICSNIGVKRSDEIPGTCFKPAEMIDVSEETTAAYIQVNFGGDNFTLFDKQLTGNIGVRYIQTDTYSSGGEAYPFINETLRKCEPRTSPDPEAPPLEIDKTLGCYLNPDDIAFANGASFEGSGSASYSHVLPSFNLKMDVTDNFVTRFALSKAMSRPDIGSLRNYIGVSNSTPNPNNPNDPNWLKDSNGEVIGANLIYSANASNPGLKPITAKQADLSFEYYSQATSVSLAVFHKEFDDYIQLGTYNREMTNNGITKTVAVKGPVNGDGAEFSGFEIQGTKWFDFLPAPFSGLGVQANYTYIKNKGVQNTGVNSASDDGDINAGQAPDTLEVSTLEGLSNKSYNLTLMYQLDGFEARFAYNWRDEFLITNSDCCIAYPVWQNDYGQLDASAKYTINETYEVNFSIQNLTGAEVVLTQQVFDSSAGGLRLPYSTNQSDTRYTASLRVNF
ncbi:TonB-dependent receptor [Paraglaciecola hydrolytica]|uniref:TonB-dependent receptor n=1 Tax=Paraglaciecola hydrolytica TaxID=1799789 RepID=A0A136A0Q0_9ALTE|nr:TonB-dependent receptor [Paraglaciecola hydrolytica]KXI28805.1 hypothetical protein AX660_11400 [Paraglaciecola hydrolytica]